MNWTFLALDCRRVGAIRPDPSEEIAVHLVELDAFTELIDDGTIEHSLVIAAHDHLQRGRRRGAVWARRLPADRNAPPSPGVEVVGGGAGAWGYGAMGQ